MTSKVQAMSNTKCTNFILTRACSKHLVCCYDLIPMK